MNYLLVLFSLCSVCTLCYTLPVGHNKQQPSLQVIAPAKKILATGNPYRFTASSLLAKHKVKREDGGKPTSQPSLVPINNNNNNTAAAAVVINFSNNNNNNNTQAGNSTAGNSTTTNSDKNWLLTKAWLIDNINRLKHELNELERDYSQHLTIIERANAQREKVLGEDVRKLREDHMILSQQLKQLIYLFRKSNKLGKPIRVSENDINYKSMATEAQRVMMMMGSSKSAAPSKRRPAKRDLSHKAYPVEGEDFTSETRRNMREVFTELSSLHDVTLSLFDYLRKLEDRVELKDKLRR